MTAESSCRYDVGQKIGQKNAEYEFDIKLPKIYVDMTDREFDDEVTIALRDLKQELRSRYSWVGAISRTGRSGGWLCVQDKTGGATKAKLQTIIGLVTDEKRRFIKRIEKLYPAR